MAQGSAGRQVAVGRACWVVGKAAVTAGLHHRGQQKAGVAAADKDPEVTLGRL